MASIRITMAVMPFLVHYFWNLCDCIKNNDNIVRVYSMSFPDKGVLKFSLKELEYKKEHEWANYPKGMIRYLLEMGMRRLRG